MAKTTFEMLYSKGEGNIAVVPVPNPVATKIAGLRFVFLINQELISLIKAEAAKMNQP